MNLHVIPKSFTNYNSKVNEPNLHCAKSIVALITEKDLDVSNTHPLVSTYMSTVIVSCN